MSWNKGLYPVTLLNLQGVRAISATEGSFYEKEKQGWKKYPELSVMYKNHIDRIRIESNELLAEYLIMIEDCLASANIEIKTLDKDLEINNNLKPSLRSINP